MEKDWLFATDEYICDLRTVAVLVKNNKILVQRDRNGNEYALPGGHIKIGETLENGLIRETMEEMGVNIKRNIMCLFSIPFPKTFFAPQETIAFNIHTHFFHCLTNQTIF